MLDKYLTPGRSGSILCLLMLLCWLLPAPAVRAQFTEYKLTAADGNPNDRFGEYVAIDGTTAVIGAFRDDDGGFDAGAVYVYDFGGGVWTQTAKLVPDDGNILPGIFDNGLFGSFVDIDNDVIVVGAVDSRENGIKTGAAYVFEKDTFDKWSQIKKFVPSDGAADDKFGSSVATNGDFALVGALDHDPNNLNNAGAVYVYARNQPSDASGWGLSQKLIPSDASTGDSFGWSVAVSGTRAVIGARDDDDRAENAGAVYIYEFDGVEWIEITKLYASDASAEDSFGEIVDIDGDQIIVGARDVDVNGVESGAAYILERQGDGTWTETAKLLASDGESLDRFGNSVAIDGDFAVASTRIDDNFSGAVYLYQRVGDSWVETSKITPAGLEAGDLFGQAVDLSGTLLISGTKGDDTRGEDAGAAHIFDLSSTDRAALIALYNATNGANWARRNNWLSNQPLGNWYGVNTNKDGRVTEIELNNNNLTGELPAAIGALPFLKSLNLRSNALSGPLPESIIELTGLEALNLGLNAITAPLPSALGELPVLQDLFLDGNALDGPIPDFLAGLTELETLYLNDNAFSGDVPPGFSGLKQLRGLHIESNLLDGLPPLRPSPDSDSNLEALSVFDNFFTFEDLEPNAGIDGFLYSPQADVGETETLNIIEENPIVMQVQVGGTANVYQWKKDGAVIPGADEDTYIVSSASVADAGVYILEVTNTLVPGLTIASKPITVHVTPVQEFEANLSPLQVAVPVLSPASGAVQASLEGDVLSVLGEFSQIQNEFGGAYLHIGAPGVATAPAIELTATIDGDQGTIVPTQNQFELTDDQILALQNGLFYVSIETASGSIAAPFAPELRGQLYTAPNAAPGTPAITSPASGTTVDLNEAGDITINWNAVTDPDGHEVNYLWVFSRNENFGSAPGLIEGLFRTDAQTSFTISHENIDAFLASQGVAQGETVTLYHLVAATDGSLFSTSAVASVNLTRSNANQPPRVSNPVADFTYLLEEGVAEMTLADIFQDPDMDDLRFEAASSNESIARVSIAAGTLTLTPVAPGITTITLTATDVFDAQATESFEMTINSRPAVVNTIADQVLVTSDDPFERSLALVFEDEDPLSFEAVSENAGVAEAVILGDGVTLQVAPLSAGSSLITVSALDDKGASNAVTFRVTVQTEAIMPPQSVAESINIAFGNAELSASYRLVALPGQVNLPLANAIDGVPDTDWIAYRDNGLDVDDRESYFEAFDASSDFTFKPGNGFWLLSRDAWQRSDNRPTVALDANRQYVIDLQPGWNIISNPFDIDIPWPSVADLNGVSQQIYRWEGSYATTPVFSSARSGNAFYFFNSENLTELKLPYIPATRANTSRPGPPALTLVATAAGDTLSVLRAGRHERAKPGIDEFDQIAPPVIFEGAGLRLLRQDINAGSRLKYLAEEYLPENAAGFKFELTLHAPADEPLQVHVSGLNSFENHHEILLFDRKLGKRYDLRKNPSLTFWAEAGVQDLVLLIGDTAYIEKQRADILPEELVLLPNYPNPFARSTTIEFAIPEPSRVRLVVYDTLGRQIRVLADGNYDAGHHHIRWNGQSDAGLPLGSGIYYYKMQLQQTQIVRSMILRR